MPAPEHGPYIKRTYRPDGTRVEEPHGFGGTLCRKATEPYDHRQGHVTRTATDEANEPSYLERERVDEAGERESA